MRIKKTGDEYDIINYYEEEENDDEKSTNLSLITQQQKHIVPHGVAHKYIIVFLFLFQ